MPYVTLQSDWQNLADKAFKSINGDLGGTWAPTTPIIINTSGMTVSGPTEVNYGGVLKSTAGSRFQLGNNEWPKLGPNHVGRSRVLRTPMHTRLAGSRYHFPDCPAYVGSIQSIALTVLSFPSQLEQPACHIPLRVHDGARLASGVMKYRVPVSRAKAPVRMPRVRIIRVDKDGKIESLRAQSATVDVDGYSYFPTVTSGDAWFAGGVAQSWAFTCDQNHTIDTSLFVYYLQLTEEIGTTDLAIATTACDGTVVRERKQDVVYVFENAIPIFGDPNPVGPPIGPTIVTGDRCLVVAGSGATESSNGLWIADTVGYWQRAADLSVPSDFTSGFLVFDTNGGAVWECVTPVYGQLINVKFPANSPGTTPVRFRKRVPRGNVYHSITCTFDQITDMRPQ